MEQDQEPMAKDQEPMAKKAKTSDTSPNKITESDITNGGDAPGQTKESPAKSQKDTPPSTHDPEPILLSSFDDFKFDEILNERQQQKLLIVKGRFGEKPNPAVVIMEKQAFSVDANPVLFSGASSLKNVFTNDIYGTYVCTPPPEINGVKATVIYPATPKHIQKYTAHSQFVITETAEDYNNITLQYLNKEQFRLQWVYNILDKKAETERVFYDDPDPESGFVMVPDMKWDLVDVNSLYASAIIRKHGIKSLRDLRGEHLPLLRNIMDKGLESIKEKYDVDASKLRIYFHYQPSYYHLHIHFTHISLDAPGSGVDRGRLLADVITNLTIDPDYYTKVPMTFTVKDDDLLLKLFKEHGRL